MFFEIKKDILSKTELNNLKNLIQSDYLPWFYKSRLTTNEKSKSDGSVFQHYFYQNKEPTSNHYKIIPNLFKKHLNYNDLILVRANLTFQKIKKESSGFHCDLPYPCKTALFYINTTNAKTIFKINNKNKEVEGIENTLVMFDGTIEHKLQFNTNKGNRYVINFNYT